jgi:hypothetical protein
MTLTQSLYLASLRQLSNPDHVANTVDVLTDLLHRAAIDARWRHLQRTGRQDGAIRQGAVDRTYVDSLRLTGRR